MRGHSNCGRKPRVLDQTNTGAAGADEATLCEKPTTEPPRRRSKRRSDAAEQQASHLPETMHGLPAAQSIPAVSGSRGQKFSETHIAAASALLQDEPFKADAQRPVEVQSDDGARPK